MGLTVPEQFQKPLHNLVVVQVAGAYGYFYSIFNKIGIYGYSGNGN